MKKAWVLSDWADVQVDLSLRWAHIHFVGFATRRLIYPKRWICTGTTAARYLKNKMRFPEKRTQPYRKFPKYSDTKNICCNHSKIWTMWLNHRVMGPNDADGMANSVDPDQTAPRSSLIRVCTVCPGISVRKLRIITGIKFLLKHYGMDRIWH